MRTVFAKRTHRGGLAPDRAGSRMTSGLRAGPPGCRWTRRIIFCETNPPRRCGRGKAPAARWPRPGAPDRQPDDDRTPSSAGPVLRLGLARQLGLDQVGEHVAHVPAAGGEHALDRVLRELLLEG